MTGGGSGGVLGSSSGVFGYWYAKSRAIMGIGSGTFAPCLMARGREETLLRSLEMRILAAIVFGS